MGRVAPDRPSVLFSHGTRTEGGLVWCGLYPPGRDLFEVPFEYSRRRKQQHAATLKATERLTGREPVTPECSEIGESSVVPSVCIVV